MNRSFGITSINSFLTQGDIRWVAGDLKLLQFSTQEIICQLENKMLFYIINAVYQLDIIKHRKVSLT